MSDYRKFIEKALKDHTLNRAKNELRGIAQAAELINTNLEFNRKKPFLDETFFERSKIFKAAQKLIEEFMREGCPPLREYHQAEFEAGYLDGILKLLKYLALETQIK